ncbi:hypothetical protein V2K57_15895 [Pseudomonas alliivorans]|nr:hypothetical protein [Pseudomonas alliivorans]MEE4701963.1 hypothetical protein [Pseudomonas alliivorans]MEE4737858.1 hypothetical protein [Pseudomonas alliivorans]
MKLTQRQKINEGGCWQVAINLIETVIEIIPASREESVGSSARHKPTHMEMRPMDKALLEKVEKLIDERFLSLDLPHLDWTLVAWYLLVAFEDHQMWMFRSAAKDDSLHQRLEDLVDRLKYSIKHALLRAKSEVKSDSNHEVPRKIVGDLYRRAMTVIWEGNKYSAALQIVSSVYDKKVDLKLEDNVIKLEVLDDVYHDSCYSVLEVIGHIEPGTITYSMDLLSWLKAEDDLPLIIKLIAETVTLKNRLLRYEYIPHFAHQLGLEMCQQPFLIPKDWTFEWGGRDETTLLLNALAIRCMYHLAVVEFGARKFMLKGGGHESLVLVLDREQLINDLGELSSIDDAVIGIFVDRLTFGNHVDVPDPALQPLIKIARRRLAIPCVHVITSHMERNLLSLQARQEPKKFDAQSGLFEHEMVADILSKISKRWPVHKANINVALGSDTEELDLVLVDRESKSVFIGELRWMLPPGDPREVQNRKKVCGEKVLQLRRKYNLVKSHMSELLENVFGIQSDDSWQVYGAVIIEGFGGAKSADIDLPVLIKYIAEDGLERAENLQQFGAWSASLEWLPREGVHFDKDHDHIETSEEDIEYTTLGITCSPFEYRQFLGETLNNFSTRLQEPSSV